VVDSADYLVTISWTDDQGTVVGRGFTVVRDLPRKDRRDVVVTATVGRGATTCVPGVVHGRIGG
jgi:hypothetical protein